MRPFLSKGFLISNSPYFNWCPFISKCVIMLQTNSIDFAIRQRMSVYFEWFMHSSNYFLIFQIPAISIDLHTFHMMHVLFERGSAYFKGCLHMSNELSISNVYYFMNNIQLKHHWFIDQRVSFYSYDCSYCLMDVFICQRISLCITGCIWTLRTMCIIVHMMSLSINGCLFALIK